MKKKNSEVTEIKFENSINIDNISFKYLNSDKEIFQDLSLTIGKGKAIGLVGKSGSGKTTLVNIILGLLSPSKGFIKTDGADILKNIDGWKKKNL